MRWESFLSRPPTARRISPASLPSTASPWANSTLALISTLMPRAFRVTRTWPDFTRGSRVADRSRASSVVRLFVDSGVGEGRLSAIGYAATRPVAPNTDALGQARNRRVAVMILAALPETGGELAD